MEIHKGDYIPTPRFFHVSIEEVYQSEQELSENGYTEPTEFLDEEYIICGKSTGSCRMLFAAAHRRETRLILDEEQFSIARTRRGLEVSEEVYVSYRDMVPPLELPAGQGIDAGFQLGAPSVFSWDTRIGETKPAFATFVKRGDRYYYQGINFAGELDSRPYMANSPENQSDIALPQRKRTIALSG